MAILVLNGVDFTEKLCGFEFKCLKCHSPKVTLDIDWAAYPSASWFNVTVVCDECHNDEQIYGN